MAQCKLGEALQISGWDVDRLPKELAPLGLAALAVGALFTIDADFVGVHDPPLVSYADVDRLGNDLRSLGRRRRMAFEGLRDAALRRAKDSDVLFSCTPASAATCWVVDYLEAVGTSEFQLYLRRQSLTPLHS